MSVYTIGALLFGLAVGSFLNVCIYRLPLGLSPIRGRSFCPVCKKPIRSFDNIPVLSYLLLKGKCRYCNSPISVQYPLIELITGIFSLLLYYKFGLTLKYPFYFAFTSALIVISAIDIKQQAIPDIITIPGIILGLFYGFLSGKASSHLLGFIVGGGFFLLLSFEGYLVMRKPAMRKIDIELPAMIGAWLGLKSVGLTILIASIPALVFCMWAFKTRPQWKRTVPFTPFLSAGALLYLFFIV